MLQSSIPILGIEEDGLVMSDFSKSCLFGYAPLSMEGMTEGELRDFNDRAEALLLTCPEDNLYFQFVTELIPGSLDVLDRHVEANRSHPLTRLVAERRRDQYREAMHWRNLLAFHVPFAPDRKKKASATRRDFDERDRRVQSTREFLTQHFSHQFNMALDPLSGVEAWRAIYRQVNPFAPEALIPEPTLPGREGYLTYPPLSLTDQLIVSDRYDDIEAMRDPEGFFEVVTLDNLPPERMNPMAICALLSRANFPLRVTLNCFLPRQAQATRELEKRISFASIFSGRRKMSSMRNAEHIQGIRTLFDDVARTGQRIIQFGLTLTLWDRSLESLRRKVTLTQSIISAALKNSVFFREIYQRPSAFIGGLSGLPRRNLRWKWGTSKTGANLMPILGPLVGTSESPRMIFGNRWNSITALDIFSARANKWAFLIIAPTGSGKSVLANTLVQSSLAAHPHPFIVIFDMATLSSYRPLMEAFGGQNVDLSFDHSHTANMFDFRLGFAYPPQDHLAFLEETLSSMLAERGQHRLGKEEESVLRRAIQRTYQRLLQEIPRKVPSSIAKAEPECEGFATWLEIREDLLNRAEAAARQQDQAERDRCLARALPAHREAMPLLADLNTVLGMDEVLLATTRDKEIAQSLRRRLGLYVDGPPSMIFNQPTRLRLDGNLTCLNLAFVKDRQELLAPLFMVLRRHIWMEAVYFEEGIPERMRQILGSEHFMRLQSRMKLVLYDEFHNLRDNPTILRMIDKDARQQRTLGMAWGIITQSLRDIVYESGDLKINLATSVASKFFLRHSSPENPQEMELRYVREKVGLNDSEAELLKSLVLAPGHYSEILVFAEGVGRGVVRLTLQPQELWLYTTHKNERYLRDAIVAEISRLSGLTRLDALSRAVVYLANRFPHGILEGTERLELADLVQDILNIRTAFL